MCITLAFDYRDSEVSCLQFILSLDLASLTNHPHGKIKTFYVGDSLSTLRLSRNANEIKTKFAKPNFITY